MALQLPTSLSPSKVSSFQNCALAFRFSAIDRLIEPPTIHTAKGTLVHRALERLFDYHLAGTRTVEVALAELDHAVPEILDGLEYALLGLTEDARATMVHESQQLVRNYFELEDPNSKRAIGLELKLEATLGNLRIRGIIDRLDLTTDGELEVVDYKTGRAPWERNESSKMTGVHIYALMCEQLFGKRPVRIKLLHLREPVTITAEPTEQTVRGLSRKSEAIWKAVERSCERDDFRPNPGKLCDYCAFKTWCPAFGGDPTKAATEYVMAPRKPAAILLP